MFGRFSTTFAYHHGGFPGSLVAIEPIGAGTYPVVGEDIVADHAVTIVQGAWFSTESATFRIVHKPE